MHNDTIEQLFGFVLVILLGIALVVSPQFAAFVGRSVSSLEDFLHLLRGLIF